MGCCSSSQLDQSCYEKRASGTPVNQEYGSPISSTTSKRSRFSCRSSSSSGVFSRCSTPPSSSTSRSIQCVGFSTTSKSSTCNTPNSHSSVKREKREAQRKLNLSCGYHSQQVASTNTSSNTDSDNKLTENLCFTKDTSEYARIAPTTSSAFDMELYMMTNTRNIMSNTSSPLVRHRNVTYEMDDKAAALPPATARYIKWEEILHKNPVTMVHNVSQIPEALSGHFCPEHFPAYTENHPAKRYKIDTNSSTSSLSLSSEPMEEDLVYATYVLSTDL